MNITVSKEVGKVEVTVLGLDGQLDGRTYESLINKARELYQAGARNFLLDLAGLTYISSAGLVALHSVALLVRGEDLPNTDSGWAALRSMEKTSEGGKQTNIKLLNPRPEVKNVLDMVGFSTVFDIFSDHNEAIQAF